MVEDRITQIRGTFERQLKNSTDFSNSFSKQVIGENVSIALGAFENKYAIAAEGEFNQEELMSTNLIEVQHINDSKAQGIIFILLDEDLLEIFISFAYDLELVVKKDFKVSVSEIYNRYLYWQKMFKKMSQGVSESAIKGLINELHMLEKYFIPKFGIVAAIKSWVGTENTHKDFAFKDGTWFEAKAINNGKNTVQISSIEQLDSETLGYLVVTPVEKTSSQNHEGENLYSIINKIKAKIESEDILGEFYNKIVQTGITITVSTDFKHSQNAYRYIIKPSRFFEVDKNFPALRKKDFPDSVVGIKYELLISGLKDFEVIFDMNNTEG